MALLDLQDMELVAQVGGAPAAGSSNSGHCHGGQHSGLSLLCGGDSSVSLLCK